jgi:hypothetical protein
MRFGEHSEGLPGSTLERGTCREKRQELGRPDWFLHHGALVLTTTMVIGKQNRNTK